MPKLKVLSGDDIIKILGSFGFIVAKQKGSHVKLVRIKQQREILTIPLHKELDRGTLKAVFKQASKYVPEAELYNHFYS